MTNVCKYQYNVNDTGIHSSQSRLVTEPDKSYTVNMQRRGGDFVYFLTSCLRITWHGACALPINPDNGTVSESYRSSHGDQNWHAKRSRKGNRLLRSL